MKSEGLESFPLRKKRFVNGSRRLAREKVLQTLSAIEVSQVQWHEIYQHIFFRMFNFGEDEEKSEKLLTPQEIIEIDADTPIHWTDDEIEFGRNLITKTLDTKDYIDKLLVETVQNWEIERISLLDKLLIYIAVTEFLKFPEIPVKVSINEAIDIAKKYSTDKSGNFINGILDTICEKLHTIGKINKVGRGLIEQSFDNESNNQNNISSEDNENKEE